MISDLLDLTRSQLGPGFPISPSAMDLKVVCRQVLDELEASHPALVLQFLPSGDLRGEWDTERIAQLISNLAMNAVQHGDETLPITITARDEGDKICLAVHNGGPPIPPEDIGSIFEPMFSMKRGKRDTGLGLGLFIVREIVKAHGGEVLATSSEEQGTTFTVRLPRHANPSQPG
jgi:signal transduction histidine kinase